MDKSSKVPEGGSMKIQPSKAAAEETKEEMTFLRVFSWILMLAFLLFLVWALKG